MWAEQLGQCLTQGDTNNTHGSLSSGLQALQPNGPFAKKNVASWEGGTGGGQDTDQEAGPRDGKALFVEVGTAEEQEHVDLVFLAVFLKDLGEFPQLSQVRGKPQGPGDLEKQMETRVKNSLIPNKVTCCVFFPKQVF